jgi:hypothetical protein
LPRDRLRLRFVVGDRVKYAAVVHELDDVCDVVVSSGEWVEGVVLGVASDAGAHDGIADAGATAAAAAAAAAAAEPVYAIGPAVAETGRSSSDGARERAALSAAVAETAGQRAVVRRSAAQLWPLASAAACPWQVFHQHDVVNVCTVEPESGGREVWSFAHQAVVVRLMKVPCAGGAVAVVLDRVTGRLSALDVSFLQLHYSNGRPV